MEGTILDNNGESRPPCGEIELCEIMDSYLEKGDYFELYSCWVGEEKDKRVGDITLKIDKLNVDLVELPEKSLVRIEK